MMNWKSIGHPSRLCAPCFLAATMLLGTWSACGQEPQPEPTQQGTSTPTAGPPKPAGRELNPLRNDEDDTKSPNSLNPDTTPLTSVIVPGLGTQEAGHSYWVPGFEYGNFVRSVSEGQVGSWSTTNFVGADLSMVESWTHSQLSLNYSGGASFSTDNTLGNGYYQQVSLVQAFTWRRWRLSLIDQFSYLPISAYGFGGTSALATPGIGGSLGPNLPTLQTNYQPSQTVFAGFGTRYSNSITTEVVFQPTPRSSFTMAGSYGFLKFVTAGNIDSNDAIGSVGYDYELSKHDSIGALYLFSSYRYLGEPQAIQDHTVQLAYGRKVTGRLALSLFGGPEITLFRVQTTGFANRTSMSGRAELIYSRSRTSLSASYVHGVSGGSGVFTGSNTDSVQGSVSRQLSRVWHGDVSFGFARNSSLPNQSVVVGAPTFDTLFVGAGVDRALGRTSRVHLGYTAYYQDASENQCVSCVTGLSHQIDASFQWHTRPLVLR
jgi:hypothetical protein